MAEVSRAHCHVLASSGSPSKIGINFDLVLGSLLLSCSQLTIQSLLSVELVLVGPFFHFNL